MAENLAVKSVTSSMVSPTPAAKAVVAKGTLNQRNVKIVAEPRMTIGCTPFCKVEYSDKELSMQLEKLFTELKKEQLTLYSIDRERLGCKVYALSRLLFFGTIDWWYAVSKTDLQKDVVRGKASEIVQLLVSSDNVAIVDTKQNSIKEQCFSDTGSDSATKIRLINAIAFGTLKTP